MIELTRTSFGCPQAEEIPSAILLEQAALADLRLPKPAMRRYAFHLVMAAQRYEKCGQVSRSFPSLSVSPFSLPPF